MIESLSTKIRGYGLLIIIGLVGITICGYGIWSVVRPDTPVVEIMRNQEIGNSDKSEQNKIYVDVAGSVEKPGVYALPSGSRIGDALVSAGGLAASANREWVGQTLNLAQVVKDGEKIYVPANRRVGVSDSRSIGESVDQQASESLTRGKININIASQSELETLWGIGQARAATIVASRPYTKIEELMEKAKLPQSVYDKIKDQISVY